MLAKLINEKLADKEKGISSRRNMSNSLYHQK